MPMLLKGSCRCEEVRFSVRSHTPVPYQRCYCSICRKHQGGGGYTINLGADARTLAVKGGASIGTFRARIADAEHEGCEVASGQRNFCTSCGSALWLFDPAWPDLIHPFASAIDTDLPVPPASVHLMLRYKASWVVPQIGEGDRTYDLYPEQSLEDWHRERGLWVA